MKEEFYSLKRDVLNKKLTNMTMLDEKRGIITLEFESGIEITAEIMEAVKKGE